MKDRIKKLRKSLDLTQREFAERIGVKQNTVGQYEIGRNEPTGSVFNLICREFNVNENWLREGTGEMFNTETADKLDEVLKDFGLSDAAKIMIRKFVELSEEDQNTLIGYCVSVAASLGGTVATSQQETKKSYDEMSIDEKIEDYRKQLLEEKEAAERSSASQGSA